MLEKPKRKKVDKQDDSRPTNIEQLIEKYDLEKLWLYIGEIIENLNGINVEEFIQFIKTYKDALIINENNVEINKNLEVKGETKATQFSGPLNGNASTSSSVVSKGIVAPESGTTKTTLSGISMQEAYSNSYPSTFGNVLNLRGKNHTGCSQLLLGWEGTALRGRIYYRSLRDTQSEWSSWGNIATAVTLYDNSSGTNGTVTLSESSANFSYLEIYYFSNLNNDYGMMRIPSPNGKTTLVSWTEMPSDSTASGAYSFGTKLSISGTSISVSNTTYGIIRISDGSFYKENRTKICRVVGYR